MSGNFDAVKTLGVADEKSSFSKIIFGRDGLQNFVRHPGIERTNGRGLPENTRSAKASTLKTGNFIQ
jgi:hypothetical protein